MKVKLHQIDMDFDNSYFEIEISALDFGTRVWYNSENLIEFLRVLKKFEIVEDARNERQ